MRLALWTPERGGPWTAAAPYLARAGELVFVHEASGARRAADLDLYHVANRSAHAFVYRALLERPGLVLLEDWGLHTLVHAATAGQGDEAGYRREARRAHGDLGGFVARQVLRGLGGELPALLPLNDRVLEASLVLVATREDVRARAAGRLRDRAVACIPFGACDPEAAAATLVALAQDALARLPAATRALAAARAAEESPGGRAALALRPFARELGLADLPDGTDPLVEGLLSRIRTP